MVVVVICGGDAVVVEVYSIVVGVVMRVGGEVWWG